MDRFRFYDIPLPSTDHGIAAQAPPPDRAWLLSHPGNPSSDGNELRMSARDIARASELALRGGDKTRKVRCVLFTTGGQVVNVWASSPPNMPRDMLDVSGYFPNGATSARVTNIPGTRTKLPRDWRIFVSNGGKKAPINRAIRKAYNVEWRGHVLMAQYSKRQNRELEEMKNIPDSQQDYAAFLLGL
ncbi:hypothetical protein CVT26_004082 [Gymnopilus dilepis]|uniref:Uncharacterized protein n=1 Tax=Gymnopilus dilepis TaxID=231916 RepID=A0A409W2B7_9AGAR|nr:hypothetical protein CVT26_004082 [Gymnopilus dilepis]